VRARSTLSLSGHELEANHHMHFYRNPSELCLLERENLVSSALWSLIVRSFSIVTSSTEYCGQNSRYFSDRRKCLERARSDTLLSRHVFASTTLINTATYPASTNLHSSLPCSRAPTYSATTKIIYGRCKAVIGAQILSDRNRQVIFKSVEGVVSPRLWLREGNIMMQCTIAALFQSGREERRTPDAKTII